LDFLNHAYYPVVAVEAALVPNRPNRMVHDKPINGGACRTGTVTERITKLSDSELSLATHRRILSDWLPLYVATRYGAMDVGRALLDS
jgi:hypothetical protein